VPRAAVKGQRSGEAQRDEPLPRVRLAVYAEGVFRRGQGGLFTYAEAFPYMLFVSEVGRHFDAATVVGRAVASGAGTDFQLPSGLGLVPLPYYEDLRRLGALARSIRGALAAMWRVLADVEVVWVFGPHPLGLCFALLALVRRRRVVLGVRQDTMGYFRARLPGRAWAPLLAPLWLLDRAFRLLARQVPTVVVGGVLERAYGGPRPRLMRTIISLARTDEIAARPSENEQDWTGVKRLLTVGRIVPEKNPLLLIDALAELERLRPGEYRLTWAGTGRLSDAVRARAAELGISQSVALPGFIPYGPELLALYRDSHVFVHVSLTEGAPQVLIEAMAAGTPMVATDVGSVRELIDGGRRGLLVPPRDLGALVAAVLETADDAEARRRRVERGLALARRHALDSETARVAGFIRAAAAG
jgi:glycosyltransferase involved in cell wall biosynthesis